MNKFMLISLPLPDGSLCKLNVTIWGDETAPRTLFCVHGLTRNGRDFDVLAKAAAEKGFRVICPDMPGRGKSDWLPNTSFYNNLINAQLCLALLLALGIKKVDWVGTSMGGLIALLIANQAPNLINKLVLNDVGCVIPAAALQRIGSYVGNSPVYANFSDAEKELKCRTLPFAIPPEYWADFAANSIEQTAAGFRLAYDPAIAATFGEIKQNIEMWPLWEAVKAIPTLLIRGAQSDLLTASTAATMQATHPHLSYYEVANAGHAPALMSDGEISKILDFVQ